MPIRPACNPRTLIGRLRPLALPIAGLALAATWRLLSPAPAAADLDEGAAEIRLVEPLAPAAPQQAAGAPRPLALPALNLIGPDDICRSWVAVQNVGAAPSQAILVAWGERRGDDPGPLKSECSGLIRPGDSWDFIGAQIPSGTSGAMIFSFSARGLGELGIDLGFDDTVAGYLCETLFYNTVGQPEAYRRFRAAYEQGGSFAGLPMDLAAGSPLVAQVLRHCPGNVSRGVEAAGSYEAIVAEAPDPAGHVYLAAPVFAGAEGLDSYAYLQNTSDASASLRIEFRPLDACASPTSCGTIALLPGETAALKLADCAPAGQIGGLRVESDRPLALTVDTEGHDALRSYAGAPAGAAALELAGPLLPDPDRGWDATVYVQNPSAEATRAEVTFRDRRGQVLGSETRELCAGGTTAFELPLRDERPGYEAGNVLVTSLPPAAGGAPQGLLATLQLTLPSDPGRSAVQEAAAYRLEALARQGDPGDDRHSGLVQAVPLLLKDLDGLGSSTELALTNYSRGPGWTDVAILGFDQNAWVSTRCRRLEAGATQYLDPQLLGSMDNGLRLSLLVSAVWWTHESGQPGGDSLPNLGLAVISRTGTRQTEDLPGDELAISQAQPIRGLPAGLDLPSVSRCLPEPGIAEPDPAPPAGPSPNAEALAAMAWMPMLRNLGQNEVCQARVSVRNRGQMPAKALLVGWGEPSFCNPQCAGPSAHVCSGLIAAGETWTFDEAAIPSTFISAVVYSLSTATLDEIGIDPGSNELVADAICATMALKVEGNCEVERRFRSAFVSGGRFALENLPPLPMRQALGPAIEVSVTRDCPGKLRPGQQVSAGYAALSGDRYDLRDGSAAQGGYRYHVQPIYSQHAGRNSIIYLQNTGLECSGVTLAFQSLGDCLYTRMSRVLFLAPGESYAFNADDIVGPDWQGHVKLSADQPLAVTADLVDPEALHSRLGYPGHLAYDLDEDGRENEADAGPIRAALGLRPGDPGWDARLDLNADDLISAFDLKMLRFGQCRWQPPAGAVDPPDDPAPQRQVLLPALSFDGDGAPGCDPRVAIQNVGSVASKAILLLWDAAAVATPEACEGPSRVECSGLIGPGGSWTFDGGPLGGFASGVLFSVDAEVSSQDLVPPPPPVALEASPADLLCETLFFGVVDDCADYQAFKRAWDGGRMFAGLPLDQLRGAPLAVRVERDCESAPGRWIPEGSRERSAYTGFGDHQLGAWDDSVGAFSYFAPIVYGEKAAFNTRLWLQNAGADPASVELWFAAQNDCGERKLCGALAIQPGEALRYAPSNPDCLRLDWQGTAWIRSSQPLAALVEIAGRSVRFAYAARPPELRTDLAGETLLATPGTTLQGPIVFDREAGWDLGVNVQNTSFSRSAWVDISYLDAAGIPQLHFDVTICPGNTETLFAPVFSVAGPDPATWGSVRVVSRPPPAAPWEPAAHIAGVAYMLRYSDAARSTTLEALSYELLADNQVGAWPLGSSGGGVETGTAVVALPGLTYDPDTPGADTELYISNLVGLPGRTQAQLRLYDGPSLVATRMLDLQAGEVSRTTLGGLGLTTEFVGSALVSATYWDHALPGPVGGGLAQVGLGAVAVTRVRSADGDARSSATLGEPLRRLPSWDLTASRPIYLPFLDRAR